MLQARTLGRYGNSLYPRFHACKPPSEARLLHYVGGKPWVPSFLRKPAELKGYIIELEKLWKLKTNL